MGDDDTIFPDHLVAVLCKYKHEENVEQDVMHSYGLERLPTDLIVVEQLPLASGG